MKVNSVAATSLIAAKT